MYIRFKLYVIAVIKCYKFDRGEEWEKLKGEGYKWK